jgi:hypothetical protein
MEIWLTHREKKPFKCRADGCGKSYCDARSLSRHQDNHYALLGSLALTGTTQEPLWTGLFAVEVYIVGLFQRRIVYQQIEWRIAGSRPAFSFRRLVAALFVAQQQQQFDDIQRRQWPFPVN